MRAVETERERSLRQASAAQTLSQAAAPAGPDERSAGLAGQAFAAQSGVGPAPVPGFTRPSRPTVAPPEEGRGFAAREVPGVFAAEDDDEGGGGAPPPAGGAGWPLKGALAAGAGMAIGAILGFMAGGPVGALIGMFAGGLAAGVALNLFKKWL